MSSKKISRFEKSEVMNSITNAESTIFDDLDQPYTLLEWVERINGEPGAVDQFVGEYNQYIKDWRNKTNLKTVDAKVTIQNVYVRFLKEIVTEYTTNEERRYLKNIDFTNKTELDAALPFFVSRIKDIIIYISKNRHQAKFQKVKYSLKGSAKGLEKGIFDTLVSYITKQDITSFGQTLPVVEDTVKNTRIIFTETYDINESYNDTQYMYTSGGEFLLEDGILYTGYYHIHNKTDGSLIYMAGKEHIPTDHNILTRIDYKIPLQASNSQIKYARTHDVSTDSATSSRTGTGY